MSRKHPALARDVPYRSRGLTSLPLRYTQTKIRHFPYAVFYEQLETTATIYAVFSHLSRSGQMAPAAFPMTLWRVAGPSGGVMGPAILRKPATEERGSNARIRPKCARA